MIYCIWYPSGGFGHFVNAVLSLHGENFMRPKNALTFSNTGDSHSLDLVAQKYHHDKPYNFNFLPNVNYSVIVDNGITNEGVKFLNTFTDATIIKMCYDNLSWPVIAHTMITKAMKLSVDQVLDCSIWDSDKDWVKREKYFLFLRDHEFRHMWKSDSRATNINITTLLNHDDFKSALLSTGVKLDNITEIWQGWFKNNSKYFMPIILAQEIVEQIKNEKYMDLTTITDIWTQAVIYYYIWLEFGVEIPHNDYSIWFTNTEKIVIMLNNLGVTV